MKALKIGLGIVALVVIVFLVMKWTGDSVSVDIKAEKKNNSPKEENESSKLEQTKPAENKDSVFAKFTQEFWALVKEKDTKKTQFDELFKKYEMDPKSGHDEHGKTFGNYRRTYNIYLSRNDSDTVGHFGFNKSFPHIKDKQRTQAVEWENLDSLENALKEALEIK